MIILSRAKSNKFTSSLFSFIFILMVLGCSKSDNPTPSACESVLSSGITFSSSFTYTGDTYTISGTKFCSTDISSVVVNDTEVVPSNVTSTDLSFKIPQLQVDSATLKIKTNSQTVDLKKKIAIYPGNGTWKAIQSFPADGRTRAQVGTQDNNVYVSGGQRYTGYTTQYNYTHYNDLYQYSISGNTWTQVTSDNNFLNKDQGIISQGTYYLFPVENSGGVSTYNTATKTFGNSTGSYAALGQSPTPFTIGTSLYECVTEVKLLKVNINKYDATSNAWVNVASTDYSSPSSSPLINFAVTYNNTAYVGWNNLNSNDLEVWSYNPTTNAFAKVITQSITTAPYNFPLLRGLFVINNLAYFIEAGDASVGPTSASITQPSKHLHMFNFKSKTWKTVEHTFPESFWGITSFTAANRGFAGMGASSSGASYIYSTNFFEFIPN